MNTDKLLNRLLVYVVALVVALGIIGVIRHFAHADSYLVVDRKTQEVKSLSPEQDCVIEEGWQEVVIPSEFKEIELQYHPTFYKWKNGKFIVNIKKISDVELAIEDQKSRREENKLIEDKMRVMAIKELKREGKKLKYVEEV